MPASRMSRDAALRTSARVWPFSRCASTVSLSDSTAETTKAQPSARQLRQERPVLQQVLDLGGEVEGDVRELGVEVARHRERVARAR